MRHALQEGIEFVWDDGDAGEQREQSGSEAFSEVSVGLMSFAEGWSTYVFFFPVSRSGNASF